jgi:hypothetical protein
MLSLVIAREASRPIEMFYNRHGRRPVIPRYDKKSAALAVWEAS